MILTHSRNFWHHCVQSLFTRASTATVRRGRRQPVDYGSAAAEVLESRALLAVTSVNIASPQSGFGMRAQVAAGEAFDVNYTAVTNLTQPLNGVNLLSTQLIATLDSTGTPTVAAKSWGAGVVLSAADTISATVPLNVTAGTYKLTVTVTQTWSTAAGGTVTSTADTFQNNSVVVTAAATTTTTVASPATAVYGSNATFTATVSGNPSVGTVQFYVGSIAPANVIGSPVNVTGGTASLTSNPLLGVGSYTILAAYSGGAGFQASSGSSTANAFSVTKAALTVTPTAGQSKVYGASEPTFTYDASGLVNSDTAATAITGGALGRIAGETVAGGSYNYMLGSLASSNYSLSLGGTNTFAITKAALTVTPTAGQSKVYGASEPTFTYDAGGLVNGDTAATAITGGTLSRTAGETVVGGPYSYTLGSLVSSNYFLSLDAAIFEINKSDLLITPTAGQSKVYGSSEPTFTYDAGGLVNGDTTATAITSGTLDRDAGEAVAGGSYNYMLGSLASSNYSLSLNPAGFTITPVTVLGSFTAANKTFDESTAATITGRFLTGVLGLDDVSFSSGIAVFDDPNPGIAKTVTLTGAVLTGADAGNYTLIPALSWISTASITAVGVNFPERSTGIAATLDTSNLPFAGPYLFQVIGGADSSFFSVNSSGQLSLDSPLDFEVATDADADGKYLVDVQVTSAADPVGLTFPIEITITDVNDPIVITSPLTQPGATPRVWTEKTPALAFDTDLSLSDQDATSIAGGRVWMQIQNYVSADRLALTVDQTQNVYRIRTSAGVDEIYVRDGSNVILLGTTLATGRFELNYVEVNLGNSPEVTLEMVQTFLRNVAFENISGGPAYDRQIQLALKVYDSLGVRNETYYSPLSIVAVPDSPVIASTLTTPAAFTENAAARSVDGSLLLSDPDQPSSWNGYLITANLTNQRAGDVLAAVGVGTDITVADGKVYNSAGAQIGMYAVLDEGRTLQFSMTGGTSSRILRAIGFRNTSEDPSIERREIVITVNDGTTAPATMTRYVDVRKVNDASDITGLNTVDYVVGDADGELIAAAGIISDVDSSNFDTGSLSATISINRQTGDTISLRTLSSDTIGEGLFIDTAAKKVFWNNIEFATFTGGTGTSAFVLSFKGTAANAESVTALLRRLVFKAATTNSSTLDRTITLQMRDGDGGVRSANVLLDFRLV